MQLPKFRSFVILLAECLGKPYEGLAPFAVTRLGSSVAEHFLGKKGVGGSIPLSGSRLNEDYFLVSI
jgi:hypothetical protein